MGARDWVLWAVLTALMVLENLAVGGYGTAWPFVAATAVLFGVAVRFRRTRPLVAFTAAGAVTFYELTQSVSGDPDVKIVHLGVLALISYLVGRHSEAVRGLLALVIAGDASLGVLTVLHGPGVVTGAVLTCFWLLLGSLIFVVLPWLYGRYREQHARLVSAGWERAERMESEQQLAVEQARLRERNRIAQDMHDSLGHELSLIALRAAALEVDGRLSEQHRRSAAELRTAAATATERLGEVIGVLRAEHEAVSTQPVTESVEQIADRAAASGMQVEVRTHGDVRVLPVVVRQAAARIAEEALTNVTKHAPGRSATVTLDYGPERLSLRVANDLPASAPDGASGTASSGRGLTGLYERVRVFGGELQYGPLADGFEVVASLPYDLEIPAASDGAATPVGSATATEHEDVRQRARRGLVTAIAAPAAVGAVIGLVMLAYYFALGYASLLEKSDYESLKVGQSRAEAEVLLPSFQMVDAPDAPAAPEGASCEFYRSSGPLTLTYAYRVCFEDDVLVSKEKVQSGSTPIEGESP